MSEQTLLPPNATDLETALDIATSRLSDVPVPLATLWNPEDCPEALLPWLAWTLSVDTWDSGWSLDAKRAVLRDSVTIHRRKGTIGAVRRALAAAGYGDATVVERFGWDFYDGAQLHDGSLTYSEPDHWAEYRVRLVRPISIAQAAQVREILATVAPTRCHLKALDFTEALNLYDNRIVHDGAWTHGVA